jgi:threonine/homoserine/homoserine lactone efflux protein
MRRPADAQLAALLDARRRLTRGAVVQILNPKTTLFFFAFLPQFVEVDAGAAGLQILILGLTFAVLGLLSDGAYALAAGTLAGRLRGRDRAAAAGRWVSGTILIGLGLTAALAGSKRSS